MSEETEPEVLNAQAEHGDVAVFRDPELMIFKSPPQVDYSRFQDALSDDSKSNAAAFRSLVLACRVHPGHDELKAILAKRPGKVAKICVLLQKLAGSDEEGEIKKS